MKNESKNPDEAGYALVTVVLLAAVLMGMLVAYFSLTRTQLSVSKATMDSTRGFYAAEAGLNGITWPITSQSNSRRMAAGVA